MKCFRCGAVLTGEDYCPSCGTDVYAYKRILRLANFYYNQGLEKARVRDLSGAVVSLEQCLRYNKKQIPARNLLGLVYFEMGQTVDALIEWVISSGLYSKKNLANDYIEEVHSNPARLESLNASLKKYNLSLIYAKHGDLDLAVIQLKKVISMNPNLVMAYQLLGLVYLKNEDWIRAKKILEKSLSVDRNNTRTLTYIREAEIHIRAKYDKDGNRKRLKPREEAISYQSGNETIIQPLHATERGNKFSPLFLAAGLILGIAIMWFLILPSKIQSARAEITSQMKGVSEELTSKSAGIDDLNKQIETLERTNQEAKQALADYTGQGGVLEDYNNLLQAAESYLNDPDDALSAADYLEKIKTTSGNQISEEFLSLYKFLQSNVSAKAAEIYLKSGIDKYNDGAYEGAIEDLTRAYDLDQDSDQALYYLAQSYLKTDDKDKASELFQKLIDTFPNSTFKSRAQRYLDQGEEDNSAAETQQETPETPAAPEQSPDPAAAPADPAATPAPEQSADPAAVPADPAAPAAPVEQPATPEQPVDPAAAAAAEAEAAAAAAAAQAAETPAQ
ncbi:MAG: tetratricopeptide repeat protein [Lachnospiraceae bacterium]|nr:tetratricopeptide repeat protein [Lachnospiraceae bacterium]